MDSRFQLIQCSHGKRFCDDRISPLPDELIFIILSFLTVTEMVKTSVLSKRWLNLWINTPVLDFQFQGTCCSSFDTEWERMQCKNLVESVNLVLRQHKCEYLKKFKTAFHLKYAQSFQKDIDGWLEFALARKVEILELNFVLPGRLQSGIYNYVFLNHYLQVDLLRCLKSLSLKGVCVDCVAINFILLNCPFLERLELVHNNALLSLVISDPSLVLKHLQIKDCPYLKVFSISNIKLVSLDTDVGNFILSDLPMLVELSIVGAMNKLSHSFSQLASYLPQLQSLTLRAFYLKELTELPNLAQLIKLKRLVIVVGAWANDSMIMLLSFMKYSYNFEEFVLEVALWKSQQGPQSSDWLRVAPISGLRQTINGRTYRCVLSYRLGIPLFPDAEPCPACTRHFAGDVFGDHTVSCISMVGVKHRHNLVRDTLLDICYRFGISVRREVVLGLVDRSGAALCPADLLLYSWDKGRDVCVDLI